MKIKAITALNFKPYGKLIEFPGKSNAPRSKNLFCKVVVEHKKVGWRIAYLVVRDKYVTALEQHPGVYESFEPVKGRSILFVACGKKPENIAAFFLDRPVVLKRGLWHGIICLGKEAEVKITEDALVRCVYHQLGYRLGSKGPLGL